MSKANYCYWCKCRISENESIVLIARPLKAYRGLVFRWRTGCLRCCNQEAGSNDYKIQSCKHCGRTLYLKADETPFAPIVTCNSECRGLATAKQLRAPRPRHCNHCAAEYMPKRIDSRFCSLACKQKAYRQRQADPGPGFGRSTSA